MISILIIISTVLVSLAAFQQVKIFDTLKFNAYFVLHSKEYWRFLSYGFIHADYWHLFVNMFVLYSFGRAAEMYFSMVFDGMGGFYYLLLYIGGLALSVLSAFGKHKNNVYYNSVGASGAVSAVVFSTIIFNPLASLRLFFVPIDIPSVIFGGIYLAYSAYMNKKGNDNIGHDAHFWGAIFGLAFTLALQPSLGIHFLQQLGLGLG